MSKVTRRDFMAASAGLVASACATGGGKGNDTIEKPNILLILTDQHRIDCLGAYGNPDLSTPNIDALAKDGVRFTNSFCPYPVCTPSRYSLISGLYVHEHRGWTNHSTLPPEIETFPALLKKAGYRTKAVGKMHYAPTYLDVGFAEMVLAEQDGPGRWDDDYHRALRAKGLIDGNDLEDQVAHYRELARPEYWRHFGALPSNLPKEWHSTEWIGERANETLRGWTSSPQLLMAGFIKPHHPFDPPAEYDGLYDPAKLTVLPGWTPACLERNLALGRGYLHNDELTEPALRRVMAYYYAGIHQIDDQVGKMLRTLKEKGLYDNTMIIFTADHGEFLGHHHMLLKGSYMYDPVVKVPLIIKYPKAAREPKTHGGAVFDGLVNNTDLAPTILAQAHCAVPERMRGLNLAANPDAREITCAESDEGRQVMARTRSKKLILHRGKDTRFFYDLEQDPHELTNRYSDPTCQDDIKVLTVELEKWQGTGGLSKTYLNEDAPVINQANVPDRHDNHRREMVNYANEKMRGDWAK